MPIDGGIFKNYAVAKGRETGRIIIPKTVFDAQQIVNIDYSELERIQKQMKKYGISLERRELIKIIKRAAKPALVAAQQNVAKIDRDSPNETTGNLWESIGFITGRSRDFPNVQVGPRAKGKWKGFHGGMVEFGTLIRSTRKGFNRGAAKPTPYMRPAYNSTAATVVKNFQNEVADYVEKVADKLF